MSTNCAGGAPASMPSAKIRSAGPDASCTVQSNVLRACSARQVSRRVCDCVPTVNGTISGSGKSQPAGTKNELIGATRPSEASLNSWK